MRRTAILSLVFAALTFGQIPTPKLTVVGSTLGRLGGTAVVTVALSDPPANLAAMQWDLLFPTWLTVMPTAGAASNTAAKTLYCRDDAVRCIVVGINANVYGSGPVATYIIKIPSNATLGILSLPLAELVGASLEGDEILLAAGAEYKIEIYNPYDVNGDGLINIADLFALIEIVKQSPPGPYNPRADVNGDGKLNVRDIQALARRILAGN